jgi:peptide/nickel transport system permease protein
VVALDIRRGSGWRRRVDPAALVGASLLAILVACALLGSRLAPYDPVRQDFNSVLQAPTLAHPFGTDQFGRDVLSRTIHGAAISLPVGFAAVVLAGSVGVTLGLLAGYYTGWMRGSIMRLSDVLMAFPHMLLALSIAAMLGRDLRNLTLAVAIAFVPQYIRVVQAAALQTSAAAYVDSARVVGAGDLRILLRHILPNVAGPIVVLAALGMALSILTAASLSFLGLGPAPPTPEWGIMLAEGRNYLADAWWIATFPGLAISTSVLAVNLLGDALRDALDPRFKRI